MPIELITALQEVGVLEVTKLLNIIYDTSEISHELTQSVFIAIPEKRGTIDFKQHKTINLMSHLTKVLLRVLRRSSLDLWQIKALEMQFPQQICS